MVQVGPKRKLKRLSSSLRYDLSTYRLFHLISRQSNYKYVVHVHMVYGR